MFTKTKLALAAALIIGSASAALAEDSGTVDVIKYGPVVYRQATVPYAAPQGRTTTDHNWIDRASQVVDTL